MCTICCLKTALVRGVCSLCGSWRGECSVLGDTVCGRHGGAARRLILMPPVPGSLLTPICMLAGDRWVGDTGDDAALSGVPEACASPVWARAGACSGSALI